jgi:hypothetical protein
MLYSYFYKGTNFYNKNTIFSLSRCLVIIAVISSFTLSATNFPTFTLKNKESTLDIMRVNTTPFSDGTLPSDVWLHVNDIGSLHQISPNEYQETELKSEIKIAYDQDNLYIKAKLFDNDKANISRNVMSKGQEIWQDDLFAIVLDPFNDKTNGYYFASNANGFKEEGLIANNHNYMGNWDGLWLVKSKVFNTYWTVEMTIPFKSLSFDSAKEQWGINFLREVKQPEQIYYWASHGNTTSPWAPEHAGYISSIQNISQGSGIDIKLSTIFSLQQSQVIAHSNTVEPSVDIVFKPTSAISTSLTFNTDFSAAEVDEQQVNLTRFSLFTPEKRNFFLQGADIFEFGDIGTNARPFFSRKMGLSELGVPLDINVGSKITGQINNIRFGAFVVNQDLNTLSSDRISESETNTLAVARISTQLSEEHTVGLISTFGNPDNESFSSLVGIDSQYRNKSFLDGDVFEIKGWYQQSINEEVNHDLKGNAYNIGFYLPNEHINAKLAYTNIDKLFDPALGFINRNNIEKVDGWISNASRLEEKWIDKLYHNVYFDYVKEREGSVSSKYYAIDIIDLTTTTQQYFRFTYQYTFEHIQEAFSLVDDLDVPSGKYNNIQWQLSSSSDRSKSFSYGAEWQKGDYFQGDMDYKAIDVTTNINRFVKLSAEINLRKIYFPDQNFTVKTLSLKADIAFSPELFWNNWIQYNNVSNEINVYSRFVWQRTPLNSFNVVINQNYMKGIDITERHKFSKKYQNIIIKLSYMWRF